MVVPKDWLGRRQLYVVNPQHIYNSKICSQFWIAPLHPTQIGVILKTIFQENLQLHPCPIQICRMICTVHTSQIHSIYMLILTGINTGWSDLLFQICMRACASVWESVCVCMCMHTCVCWLSISFLTFKINCSIYSEHLTSLYWQECGLKLRSKLYTSTVQYNKNSCSKGQK